MKRNIIVSVLSGFCGSALLLILLSAAGIVGARTADVRSDMPRANAVSAATPLTSTFTYQGQLKNGSNAVNGSCQMAFRLYDDPLAGNLIGNPITPTVPVTNGLFTVGLNFGNNGNIFDGNGRWLDIQVKCGIGGFVALTPRQALTAAAYAFALPGLYTQPSATSPNIIGGYSGNFISATATGGVIGGGGDIGYPNRVQADYGTVGGGAANTASGIYAAVGGGAANIASQDYATVGGGYYNTANGNNSTIGGGYYNTVGYYATVGGGEGNIADNDYAAISGGYYNTVTGTYATVGGGFENTASGGDATVGGGVHNLASGKYAAVPGGDQNSATMTSTFAAGHRAQANHQGAFVWADSTNADFASTANDQFLIRANGGVGINTNSPAANTLTVSGNGIRIATNGTTIARVQAGTYTSPGVGLAGVNVFTITFPSTFSTVPKISVTPRNNFGSPVNDTFVVTTRSVSTSAVTVNVYRIDNSGGSWGQQLQFDWFAWE